MSEITTTIKTLLHDILLFAHKGSDLRLRPYQEAPARAIIDSVVHQKGLTFVVIFPRQSGKNELQAQIETYLMALYSPLGSEMVKISPTHKPQSLNAMRRLERMLDHNLITKLLGWTKEQGFIYRVGATRITFLSGAASANVVGATASLLLECDEAQEVSVAKWDKEINPMAASTNATRIFWGTAWTSKTLLAREMKSALDAQTQDGQVRVFKIDAEQVRESVPAYGKFVDAEIAKLGRNHPFVKTQYFSEEIDADAGMFPTERLALMQGNHPPLLAPRPDQIYAACLDLAGEDENACLDPELALSQRGRDSTALTIFEVDLSTLDDELIKAARYKVVQRYLWTGIKHSALYAALRGLVEHWRLQHLVIDATGVGEAMASFLDKAFPGVVIPFKFSLKSKSDLGWSFIALVETGRFKEYIYSATRNQNLADSHASQANKTHQLQALFWKQCAAAQLEILPGPGRIARWSVPDTARDAQSGELIHDDLLISAALCSRFDALSWGTAASMVIQGFDPLSDMKF